MQTGLGTNSIPLVGSFSPKYTKSIEIRKTSDGGGHLPASPPAGISTVLARQVSPPKKPEVLHLQP